MTLGYGLGSGRMSRIRVPLVVGLMLFAASCSSDAPSTAAPSTEAPSTEAPSTEAPYDLQLTRWKGDRPPDAEIFNGANLTNADLSGADLTGANLIGATMPDGSVHV